MLLGTTFVLGDEKAFSLCEFNLLSPTGLRRRYEIIKVMRDDKMSEYRRDMGKVTKLDQIRIPSYLEHTVNELREMANQLREKQMDKLDLVQLDKIREG